MGRDEEIAERAGANLSEFMEHGPGLRYSTRHWILRRCPNGHVELGGLGGMGVGTMWSNDRTEETIYEDGSRTAPYSEDPTYAEAPVDGSGCTVCHPIDWSKITTSALTFRSTTTSGEATIHGS